MTIDLPTYIPLNEATRRYRIGAQALTQTHLRLRCWGRWGGGMIYQLTTAATISKSSPWREVSNRSERRTSLTKGSRSNGNV